MMSTRLLFRRCGLLATALLLSACEQKAPNAPSTQVGESPSWGQGFGTKPPAAPGTGAQAMLEGKAAPRAEGELPPGHPPVNDTPPPAGDLAARGLPAGNVASAPGNGMPNDSIHAGLKAGGAQQPPVDGVPPDQPAGGKGRSGTDWSGGDVTVGRAQFQALCARCHGAEGKGGTVANVGVVPNLTDPAVRARWTGDAHLASVIAHGKGAMPSFMAELDLEKLKGLVAYLQSMGK